MSKELTKSFEELKSDIVKFHPELEDVSVGDLYYYKHDGVFRIESIFVRTGKDWQILYIKRKFIKSGEVDRERFENLKYCVRVDKEIGQTDEEFVEELDNDVMRALVDPSFLQLEADGLESENSIIPKGTKKFYEDTKALLEQRKRRVELIKQIAERKLNALSSIANDLQKTLSKVMKVVHVLELYLGVHEEVFQLQEGIPAAISEPISIRQRILYMDEEVAIVDYYDGRNGALVEGIDFSKIAKFDEWILEDGHIDQILPEKRGIVILRPSRNHKVTGDMFADMRIRINNLEAYILIRNGENVYRIHTGEKLGDRFFPTLEEDYNIMELLEKEYGYERDRAEDDRHAYVRNMLIIQGILDRTSIFQPLPKDVRLTDPTVYDKEVVLIRDDESLLPDGRQSFHAWQEEINSSIDKGSRVIVTGIPSRANNEWIGRFGANRWNWHPPLPGKGLYVIEEDEMRKSLWSSSKYKHYKILYMPNHSMDYRWEQRKYRVAFWLHEDDDFILNYDMISLEDVDYYINSREARRKYLKIVPILAEIRERRLKEIEQEKMFVNLLANELNFSEEEIWEAVDWWKYKNIWKRPITEDDAKAWRMIRKRLEK